MRRPIIKSPRDFTSRHIISVVVKAINFWIDEVIAGIFENRYLAACLKVATGQTDRVLLVMLNWRKSVIIVVVVIVVALSRALSMLKFNCKKVTELS